MIKYFKEMRELKKLKMQYIVMLLGKVYDFTEQFNDFSDIMQDDTKREQLSNILEGVAKMNQSTAKPQDHKKKTTKKAKVENVDVATTPTEV